MKKQDISLEKKSLIIYKDTWGKLQRLKIKYDFKTLDGIINYLLMREKSLRPPKK